VVAVIGAMGGIAAADVWQGAVKSDAAPCPDCKAMTVVARPVDVILLGAGGAKDGDAVTVVQPLLGMAVGGVVKGGNHVALASLLVDRRANHDGVFVVPGAPKIVFVAPTAADLAAAKLAVGRVESLEKVRKATARLELGLVDLDGDGKPDLGSTYGCKVWGDGICQVEGQFLLVKKPGGWVVLE
jgi:hypothetical protein